MIDLRSEAAQRLVDRAAQGTLDRRRLLSVMSATGLGVLLSGGAVDAALAAGNVQRGNRAALETRYDYIVVGAGAAGCIIASRLAAADFTVLLVEAGGSDDGPQVDDPSIWFTNIGGPLDWAYPTISSPFLNGRSIPIGAGKLLGGGTSINASLWVHGFAHDFDGWANDGCAGWSFADILPTYKSLENWTGEANEWRGSGGPMDVCLPKDPHPTAHAWLEGSRTMGFAVLDDMNAPMREGAGLTNMSIRPDGSRASAARAYLRPALGLKQLTLVMNTPVQKLVMNGTTCKGVQLLVGGVQTAVAADRETIVTAGGIGSAKLLMLSGIGKPEDLKPLGIAVVGALPGVGGNFQDHPLLEGVVFHYKGKMPPRRAGSNAVEATSFLRSSASRLVPNLQPVLIQLPVVTAPLTAKWGAMPPDAFTIAPGLVRPSSRGWMKLASADWRHKPVLDSGFLSTDADLAACMECIELCRELGHQPAFDDICSEELIPGKKLAPADLANFARDSATSYYHPVGTCKMGVDTLAVVDPELRVHGIDRLRVCDSSVMPTITTGNTNAPSQMIGARAAALILAAAGVTRTIAKAN